MLKEMPKWILFIFLLDQITKIIAVQTLSLGKAIAVLPGFNIMLAFNQGAAFSVLGDGLPWQKGVLIGISILVSCIFMYWYYQVEAEKKLERLALLLIIGGAVSNLFDRLRLGYVVDFIEVYYKSFYWPTFNIADMAITIGASLLVIALLKDWKHNP